MNEVVRLRTREEIEQQKRIANELKRIADHLEKKGRKAFWNGDTLGEPWWPGK